MGALHVGTSGWVYPHWRGVLYPPRLPARRWLAWYARVFSAVELNATFYRLPTAESVERWREEVPGSFRFACKGSRYLTHMLRLNKAGPGLERYFERVRRLGPKLGPVLWQLPPQWKQPEVERLERFLRLLPREVQHAFEFRHPAWHCPQVLKLLERHGVAVCEHDALPAPAPSPTGGWRYLRFHGASAPYSGRYGPEVLSRVAEDLATWQRRGRTAWVFFNNDAQGHAVRDALELAGLLGLRVPEGASLLT